MPYFDTTAYLSRFKKELTDNLLSFWMPRCLDVENGGYLNCFCNDGSRLVSTDKYTWSQGRFLWMFSKLATAQTDLFDEKQREQFLQYAKSGYEFLKKHVLIAPDDLRCVFLAHADGTPKRVGGLKSWI
jgi:N-acylglucosamine 2-epimerase